MACRSCRLFVNAGPPTGLNGLAAHVSRHQAKAAAVPRAGRRAAPSGKGVLHSPTHSLPSARGNPPVDRLSLE